MKISVDYFDAFDCLDDFTASKSASASDDFRRERYAIITHWLQSTSIIPPYVPNSYMREWESLLKIKALHLKIEKNDRNKRIKTRMVDPLKSTSKHTLSICLDKINFPSPKKPVFSFIDLFAGIGGFRLALQENKGQCVFSSELDKKAQETYFNNFGEYPFGDLTQFTNPHVSDGILDMLIPDHDLLAAGFPCQPFSLAGVSARNANGIENGFDCVDQGTLFFDLMRIVKVKKPKVLFLENTSNIFGHNKGNTFTTIKEKIEELGYSFSHCIIDASTVVPQRRKRCYMICFRNSDIVFQFHPKWFEGESKPLSSILEEDPDPMYTISDKLWEGHQKRSERNRERGTGFLVKPANINAPANTLLARYGKDGKGCLIEQEDGENPRMLTIRECARLQGFPEEFEPAETRTPAYRQFGNSVAVPVVNLLAQKIMPYLKKL